MARHILIGVTGGIAAYKTAMVVSRLAQGGLPVQVVMSRTAEQFIGPATFAALTGRPVAREAIDPDQYPLGAHIELAQSARLFCIAPATAHFMAKAAHGLADDLLSTLYLSYVGPVVMAPAMNCEMWEKPAVQRNVEQLRRDGVEIIDPEEGWLSCRQRGVGRMADPERILHHLERHLQAD